MQFDKTSSAKSKLRASVAQILSSGFNVASLDRIFLSLRSRTRGNFAVRDVGDAIAHQEGRSEGLSFRWADRWCAMDEGILAKVWSGEPPTLAVVRRRLDAALASISDNTLAARGVDPSKGRTKLERSLKHIVGKAGGVGDDGGLLLPDNLPAGERTLYSALMNQKAVPVAFTPTTLTAELVGCLRREDVLDDGEAELFFSEVPKLACYVATIFHNLPITVSSGRQAWFEVDYDYSRDETLSISLFHAIDRYIGTTTIIPLEIHAHEHCTPDLAPVDGKFGRGVPRWNFPIRIDDDWKITRAD